MGCGALFFGLFFLFFFEHPLGHFAGACIGDHSTHPHGRPSHLSAQREALDRHAPVAVGRGHQRDRAVARSRESDNDPPVHRSRPRDEGEGARPDARSRCRRPSLPGR